MNTQALSNLSWDYEYLPYVSTDSEDKPIDIPCYRIACPEDPENYICETNEHLPGDEQERHARLISAAPDLFKALMYFFNIMHDYESSRRKGYVRFALDQSRTALEKAKGGPI